MSETNSLCLSFLNRRRRLFCNGHSFLWLTIEPENITDLPSSTYSDNSGWFDQGWLVLQPNTASYTMKMLTNPTTGSSAGFSTVPVEKLKYVHRYSMTSKGGFEGEVEVMDERKFNATYAIEDTGTTIKCCTLRTPYHTTGDSLLRVKPVPTSRVLLAISFVPKQLPDVTATDTHDYISTFFCDALIWGITSDIFRMNGLKELADDYNNRFMAEKVRAVREDNRQRIGDDITIGYDTGANRANYGQATVYTNKMYGSD